MRTPTGLTLSREFPTKTSRGTGIHCPPRRTTMVNVLCFTASILFFVLMLFVVWESELMIEREKESKYGDDTRK